jgi:carbon-monoxide dehydrogenase medium subunit
MFPASFEYHRANSVKEALTMLQQFGEDAKLLAGGHSLLPMMKLRLAQPSHLVDIGRISELSSIKEEGGKIVIGGAATHEKIENSELVRGKLPLLAECAGKIGDVQVRNRGTIGGSLAHADPAADYPAAVLASEAELRLESSSGARSVKAADFFLDLLTTAAKPGEILTQIIFPIPAAGTGSAYAKHPQPASGFAVVGVAALLKVASGGKCETARVGVTGLGAKAFRAAGVESALSGKAIDGKTIDAAAAHAADGIDAMSDIHASAEFRAELARVYAKRALEQALSRCKR